ncbi:ABC transporter ATP-binding protein [Halovenus marina]|uniref:ABC transporter ATP-binding protein n=1 Tax=Halovenus marina TaxID=3396621 RepID=UPI003F55111D
MTKTFGGITALWKLSIKVQKEEITGLIGPNGAGKTTLFNVITGMPPDEGQVMFGETDITGRSGHEICHHGIGRTFQTPQPFQQLTVERNLQLAQRFGTKEDSPTYSIDNILETFDLDERRDSNPDTLQLMERKYLDIARALMTEPDLLLLDEIMAGLNASDKNEMIDVIHDLHDRYSIDFFIVEHDLRVMRKVSDRLIAINQGELLASGSPETVLDTGSVKEAYVG